MAGLAEIFDSRSVAVVGTSQDPSKAGHQVFKLLIDEGYTGGLFGVHPTEREVLGRPCFASLRDIPEPVDLLIVAVSARAAVQVMEEAADRGDVKGAVVLSAGFAETETPEGIEAERRLVAAARRGGIRVFGPNCIGIANPHNRLNTGFAPGMKLVPGNVGYVTQSGAFGGALLMFAGEQPHPLGFARFGHVGNMCDVSNLELLSYFGEDPGIGVIGMYMEGVRDGREFLEVAARASEQKPILVMKVGRSEQGARAALSHTGAIAGSDRIYHAAFRQSGVVRLSTTEELTDGLKAVSVYPRVRSNRVCVLTETGGTGIICTDAISEAPELELAPVTERTRLELVRTLPSMAMVCKPNGYVDMTPAVTPEQQAAALRLLLADPNVDLCVLVGFPPIYRDPLKVARTLAAAAVESDKPVAVCFMRGACMEAARSHFEQHGVPTFDTPERTVGALRTLVRASTRKPRLLERRAPRAAHPLVERALAEGRGLLEPEAIDFLADYGLPVLTYRLLRRREEALSVVEEWDRPVVLKIVSPGVIHKSDVGGVRLGLRTPEEAGHAYDAILAGVASHVPEAEVRGVLAVPMAEAGTELIAGVVRDPQFGPAVMFGLGGVFVELFQEVSFRIAPFDRETALEMVQETRAWQILQGVRGEQPKDVEALLDLLVRLSRLAVEYPAITEIDLNPIRVYEHGVKILDARIALDQALRR